MLKRYAINNIVSFDAETGDLENINHPELKLSLRTPASRCLQLLIENKGRVVSQQEFLDKVWRNYGQVVSINTLYQNILLIRKGLIDTGISEEIIKTISKKGLKLDDSVKIIENFVENKNETIIDNTIKIKSNIEENTSKYLNDNKGKPRYQYQKRTMKITIFFLLILQAGLIDYKKKDEGLFLEYNKTTEFQSCIIYTPEQEIGKNELNNLLKNMNLDCSVYNKIYVTKSDVISRLSIIRCKSDDRQIKNCISDYYIGSP